MTGTQSANQSMSDAPQYPSLASVEREMAAGRFWPVFAPHIEALYRSEAAVASRTPVILPWLIGILLYDMFLASDYVVAADDIALYATFRLAFVTPACLALLFLAIRFPRWYNCLVSVVPVLLSATLGLLLMITHGSYRADYLFGNILILICACVLNRSPLGYALWSVLLQCLVFHIVLLGSDIAFPGGKLLHALFCLSGAVVALITSYTLERDRRQTFLLGLRVRLLNRELESVAMTDPLTGLANRRRLAEVADRFWAKQLRTPTVASVILIDVDYFKSFNDHLGHVAGDACLETIARQVCLQLRHSRDLAVRFGGEEMLVFLPDTGFDVARDVAEAICGGIRAAQIAHPALGEKAIVTASLGVYSANPRDCTMDELIAFADAALYAAKAAGRNRVWPLALTCTPDPPAPTRILESSLPQPDGRAKALA